MTTAAAACTINTDDDENNEEERVDLVLRKRFGISQVECVKRPSIDNDLRSTSEKVQNAVYVWQTVDRTSFSILISLEIIP